MTGLSEQFKALVDSYGLEAVLDQARRMEGNASNICTILVNEGLHEFPDSLFIGEKYVFYRGSMDLSSEEDLHAQIVERLISLKEFLRSKKWSNIYVIISGHASICMQVKLAVYRITHIETIDWVFDGHGKYTKLKIPMREILIA